MKKIPFILLYALSLFCACDNKHKLSDYELSTKSSNLPEGQVLFSKENSSYYYDLAITDSFYLFLNNQSDTVLQVYQKNNLESPYSYACRKYGRESLWQPTLIKSGMYANPDKNICHVIDNELFLKKVFINDKDKSIKTETSVLFKELIHSSNYCLTSKEIYAVPIYGYKRYPFYYFNVDSEYYWVDSAPVLLKEIQHIPLAFTSSLCVNESANAIVCALRFSNYIQFYNLKGELQTVVKFGDKTILPLKKPPVMSLTSKTISNASSTHVVLQNILIACIAVPIIFPLTPLSSFLSGTENMSRL